MTNGPIAEFNDLHVTFRTPEGDVEAVRGVSFEINQGETVGIVGESGSGKSVTAMTLLRLNDIAGAHVPRGNVYVKTKNIEKLDIIQASGETMQSIRGREIAMIFQEPMTCLNPVLSLRVQLIEPLQTHQDLSKADAEEKVIELLKRVRIPDAEKKLDQYPHHLSGGMRQRVMIAMALSCTPSLLIADEPTTALDVTIQAQIMDLIKDLQTDFGMSVMFITHDMAVIAEMADRVIVMFQGKVVEQGPVDQIFHDPKHDYTKKLINAVPRIGSMAGKNDPEKFPLIS